MSSSAIPPMTSPVSSNFPTATISVPGTKTSGFNGVFVTAASCLTEYYLYCTNSASCNGKTNATYSLTAGHKTLDMRFFTEESGVVVSHLFNCSFPNDPGTASCTEWQSTYYNGTAATSIKDYITTAVDRSVPITGNQQAFLQATQTCSISSTVMSSNRGPTSTMDASSGIGLSRGSKAGISLALATVVLVAVGLLIMVLRRRRKQRASSSGDVVPDGRAHGDLPPRYDESGGDGKKEDDYALNELEASSAPVEMPVAREPVEIAVQEVQSKPEGVSNADRDPLVDVAGEGPSPVSPLSTTKSR